MYVNYMCIICIYIYIYACIYIYIFFFFFFLLLLRFYVSTCPPSYPTYLPTYLLAYLSTRGFWGEVVEDRIALGVPVPLFTFKALYGV